MIIAHISDTHITLRGDDADKRVADFQAVIDDINRLDPQPDVILHSGDIVHNGLPEEYAIAASTLAKARAPAFAMVGNKDDRANMVAAFSSAGYLRESSNFIDYAIDDYPVRIVVLDTLKPGSSKGTFCDERFANLSALIEGDTDKPVAVFMHHPPFEVSVGPDPQHFESHEMMTRMADALQVSGRVIGIFCGHVHRSNLGYVGNIPATIMTAVATPLRWGEYAGERKSRPVYQIHRYDVQVGFVTETRIVD